MLPKHVLDLLTSKKFTTAQLGMLSVAGVALYLPPETRQMAMMCIAFITGCAVIGQGISDLRDSGKQDSRFKTQASNGDASVKNTES